MKKRMQLSHETPVRKRLIDLMNDAYQHVKGDLPYNEVSEFITSDVKSVEFIRTILQDSEFETPNKDSELYSIAQTRGRHSAITFLIGLVFFEYQDFSRMIANSSFMQCESKTSAINHLWMLTSLYHDYGYFLTDINNAELDHKSKVKYFLLSDSCSETLLECLQKFSKRYKDVLAYTYDEIATYDKIARQWHMDNDIRSIYGEKTDHGILGGIRIYDRLIGKVLQSDIKNKDQELLLIKTSCLTIAQHNIFKSSSPKDDLRYDAYEVNMSKLHFDSSFRISNNTPLLLLLSLVDTFECIKRFGKGSNPYKNFQTLTVLSNITLSISKEKLYIDFSGLYKLIQEKANNELYRVYKKYYDGLLTLSSWTSFKCEACESAQMIVISNQNLEGIASH